MLPITISVSEAVERVISTEGKAQRLLVCIYIYINRKTFHFDLRPRYLNRSVRLRWVDKDSWKGMFARGGVCLWQRLMSGNRSQGAHPNTTRK